MEHFQEKPANRQPAKGFATDLPPQPLDRDPGASRTWQVGQRVLAAWPPELSYWYPAAIQAINGQRYLVDYDDGAQAELDPQQLMPLDIRVGSRVWCRWKAGQVYYPGKVDKQDGDRLHVAYDDGDKEWTTVSLMRVQRRLRVRIADAEVAVHGSADLEASVIALLDSRDEVEVSQSFKVDGQEWVEVLLANGRRGFVLGASRVQPLRQRVLWEAEAELFAEPALEASSKGRLQAGEAFYCLDQTTHDGQSWWKIRDGKGMEAFLPGTVPSTGAIGESSPSWLGSVMVGGLLAVVVFVALGLKGKFGFWQMIASGRLLDLLGLLALCVGSAGVAGCMHYLLTPMRRHPVGRCLSWMWVLITFLFTMASTLLSAAHLDPDRFEEMAGIARDPWLLAFLAGTGVLTGLWFGYGEQNTFHTLENQRHSVGTVVLPLLAAGMGALVVGLLFLWLGARDWALAFEAKSPPQELTAAQLLRDGYGSNRNVFLKEFQFCRGGFVEHTTKANQFLVQDVWIPVVAGRPANPLDPPPSPTRVRLLIAGQELKPVDAPLGLPFARGEIALRRQKEAEGYRGMVVNGVKSLPPAVRQKILEVAPETDLTEVILLDERMSLVPAAQVEQCFWGGGIALLLGLLLVVGSTYLSGNLGPSAHLQPIQASSLCRAN